MDAVKRAENIVNQYIDKLCNNITPQQKRIIYYAEQISNSILNIIREKDKQIKVDLIDVEELDLDEFIKSLEVSVLSIKNRMLEENTYE